MATKNTPQSKLIVNRRARFDYELHDHVSVGIVLQGAEVRAVRDGHVSLRGAYATIKDGELWLTNASFSLPARMGEVDRVVDTRPRKLLAKKSEINKFIAAKDSGLTIVPLSMTTNTRYIKVELASAKGKKQYDKRETIKRRDTERETKRLLKRS